MFLSSEQVDACTESAQIASLAKYKYDQTNTFGSGLCKSLDLKGSNSSELSDNRFSFLRLSILWQRNLLNTLWYVWFYMNCVNFLFLLSIVK